MPQLLNESRHVSLNSNRVQIYNLTPETLCFNHYARIIT